MRIATVGTSGITKNLIAAFLENKQEVVAVYSRNLEKGQKFADEVKVKKVYTDLETMFSQTDIDVIYLASPNSLHFTHAKLALEKGKNVIIEKPICSNANELKELIALAKAKNLFFFEAATVLHLPNYYEIANNLENLGQIRIVETNFSKYSSRYDNFLNGEKPNIFNPQFSAGALMDLNFYNIAFIVGLFGKAQDCHYFANVQQGIDTSGIAVLDYGDFKAVAISGKDSNGKSLMQIQGEEGNIFVDSRTSQVKNLALQIGDDLQIMDYQDVEDAYYYEIKEFISAFENKDQAFFDKYAKVSLDIMETLDALRKSANIVFAADK